MVPKWMGKIDNWGKFFKDISNIGYNMIHFVPIQQRGHSNSPYSICNQLSLSDDMFSTDCDRQLVFKDMLGDLRQKGIYSAVDLVLNHTSCDSGWLIDHPDSGFNLENSPHLYPAFVLDEGILEYSKFLEVQNLNEVRKDNLDELLSKFRNDFIPKLQLWTYFVIDIDAVLTECRTKYKPADQSKEIFDRTKFLRDECIKEDKSKKFRISVDCMKVVTSFPPNLSDEDLEIELKKLKEDLDSINLVYYQDYDEKIKIIISNLRNRLEYERLAPHGPKLGRITKECPLVSTYFTRVIDNNGKSRALANNGWIWNANPMINFASSVSEAYLLREIIIWGDCVKLNYGDCPEDNPFLWNHMLKYSSEMGHMFDAIRIDNCHSTPLHVANFFLKEIRKINPNIYIFAELFTGSPKLDEHFVTTLGIDSLIREAMHSYDASDLARQLVRYGKGSMTHSSKRNLLGGSLPHALFMDCTHDNEVPSQSRTFHDFLPNAATVAFSASAIGSTYGYDYLIPKTLNIVSESREYDFEGNVGVSGAKKILYSVRDDIIKQGMTEMHVSETDGVLQIVRENPNTHDAFMLIAYSAFDPKHAKFDQYSISSPGFSVEFLYGAKTVLFDTEENSEKITGTRSKVKTFDYDEIVHRQAIVKNIRKVECTELSLKNLEPGMILLFKKSLLPSTLKSVNEIEQKLCHLSDSEWNGNMNSLGLIDCNVLLYRCNEEELDTIQSEVYTIPGLDPLPYAGIAGFWYVVKRIIRSNDMNHPLCNNLRDGLWAIEYISRRLKQYHSPKLNPIANDILDLKAIFSQLPSYLIPKYFCLMIESIYSAALKQCFKLMKVGEESEFVKKLALGSVQMIGIVNSTSLCPNEQLPSLSAGLPHFTTHHMRCWGRDTFISFKGMFLLVNRFEEARQHLMTFASCIKHGLIPNLLDCSKYPRYNARDASWWFFKAVKDYCDLSEEGNSFLMTKVKRRFPTDNFVDYTDPLAYSTDSSILEILLEIISTHHKGLKFREHNAGPYLDHAMSDEGFNVEIGVDEHTGFVFGGNQSNCGTWMDKMGDSVNGKNFGIPSTPRNGSPVEIVGLQYLALTWIDQLIDDKVFENTTKISFKDWKLKLESNFESHFFMRDKGYYKDCLGSTQDSKLRPNFLVVLALSPQLVTKENALSALSIVDSRLMSVLGVKTLDPSDSEYRGNYFNFDSDDYKTANGFNYHQGPEWVWLFPYYFLALKQFDSVPSVYKRLLPHFRRLESEYFGIEELTNENGSVCNDSCKTQAWSMGCILELLKSLQ